MKPPKKKKAGDIADLFGDSPAPPVEEKNAGAPAALSRWANQERKEFETVEKLEAQLENLLLLDRDDDEINTKIRVCEGDLSRAKDAWAQTSKILLSFDSKVSVERREGEKIPVAEAREIFAQYELSLRLAMEAYIIKISQDAALCDSAEGFHLAHADAIRACREGAISAARRDGVLPAWLT